MGLTTLEALGPMRLERTRGLDNVVVNAHQDHVIDGHGAFSSFPRAGLAPPAIRAQSFAAAPF
jgi:hypothetical protein